MNVLDLKAVLTIDTSAYEKALKGAVGAAKGMGGAIGNVIGGAMKIGTAAIGAATAAVGAFGASSVKTGMSFDSAMSQVAATMGLTMDEMETEVGKADTSFGHFEGTLREFAQFMGEKTAFSATQAAEALNYMALAGYDLQESMDMLPNVLNLAAAGSMDLALASDMITDAQTALGLTFGETNTLVDQMAKTASTTNTSVSQLGDAILTVGGTAQYMSGGTNELNAVLGVLADNGIKGSEAGTHLRNMLLKLASPTKQGAAWLDALGVSVFDAEGKMRSFQELFPELNAAMSDLTEEQKLQALADIFNVRDIASANALLTTTAERWTEVGDAIMTAEGAAAQMAATQLDNLAGDVTLLKSAFEGVQIQVSDMLTPAFRNFVKSTTSGLSEIATSLRSGDIEGAFNAVGQMLANLVTKVVELVPKMVEAGARLLVALGQGLQNNAPQIIGAIQTLIGMIVGYLSQAIPQFMAAATEWMNGMADKMRSFDWGAAARAITDAIKNFLANEGVQKMAMAALNLIMALARGLVSAIPQLIPGLIDIAGQIVANLYSTFISLLPKMHEIGIMVLTGLLEGLLNGIDALVQAAKTIFDSIVGAIKSLFGIASPSTVMMEIGGWIIEGLLQGVQAGIDLIAAAFQLVFDGVMLVVQTAWEFITTTTTTVWQSISTFLSATLTAIQTRFSTILTAIRAFLEKTWNQVKTKINTIWTAIKNFFITTLEAIKTIFTNVFNAIRALVETIMSAIKSFIDNVMNAIKTTVTTILTAIQTFINTTINAIKSFIETTVNAIKRFIETAMNAIKNTVDTVFNAIKTVIQNAWNNVKSTTETVLNGVKTSVTNIWNSIKTTISGAVDSVKSTVSNAWNSVRSTTESVWNGIKSFLSGVVENIKSIFSGGDWGSVGANIIHGISSGIGSAIGGLVEAAANAARSALGAAKSALGIASPSKLARKEVGNMFGEGIRLGILDEIPKIEAATNLATKAIEGSFTGGEYGTAKQGAVPAGFVQNVTINSPKALSPSETTRLMRNQTKSIVLAVRPV